jgi:hypothetical protein
MANDYLIFGIQASGTQFVDRLIRLNFDKDAQYDATMPGHSLTKPSQLTDPAQAFSSKPIIIVYKNPYTWMETLSWFPAGGFAFPPDGSIEGDLIFKAMDHTYEINVDVSAHMYKQWITNWFKPQSTIQDRAIWIRYEDLLVPRTREMILDDISRKFGWTPVNSLWQVPYFGSTVNYPFDYEAWDLYYIQEKPKWLSTFQLEHMNSIITTSTVLKLGYTPIYEYALHRYMPDPQTNAGPDR